MLLVDPGTSIPNFWVSIADLCSDVPNEEEATFNTFLHWLK